MSSCGSVRRRLLIHSASVRDPCMLIKGSLFDAFLCDIEDQECVSSSAAETAPPSRGNRV